MFIVEYLRIHKCLLLNILNLHCVFLLIGHFKLISQRVLDSQLQYKQKNLEFGAFSPIILYINFQSPEK